MRAVARRDAEFSWAELRGAGEDGERETALQGEVNRTPCQEAEKPVFSPNCHLVALLLANY